MSHFLWFSNSVQPFLELRNDKVSKESETKFFFVASTAAFLIVLNYLFLTVNWTWSVCPGSIGYDKKEWGIQQSVWWQRNSRNKWITKLALLVILSGYQRTLDHNFSICIQCSHTPSKQFCNLFVLLPFVSNFSTDWKRATQGVWKSHKKSHTTLRAKRAIFTIWGQKLIFGSLHQFLSY